MRMLRKLSGTRCYGPHWAPVFTASLWPVPRYSESEHTAAARRAAKTAVQQAAQYAATGDTDAYHRAVDAAKTANAMARRAELDYERVIDHGNETVGRLAHKNMTEAQQYAWQADRALELAEAQRDPDDWM